MADTMIGGGSGGSMVIMLRVLGISGTTISATCDGNTVSGTIGSVGYLYLKLKTLGVWSVTASKSGYSFTQDVKVFRYGITECWALAKKAFYDCTPAEIQAIAKSGMANQYWAIGDYHKITLTTGEEIEVAIADFNHDVTPGGVTIPLTLAMRQCLNTKYPMNATATIAGSWPKTLLRTSTLPSILASFPDDWRNIITKAKKLTGLVTDTNVTPSIIESSDDLWLFSEVELSGGTTGLSGTTSPGEGTQYPLFSDAASRIRTSAGTATYWWTRSPVWKYAQYSSFKLVYPDGTLRMTDSNANNKSYAVCLGFCVG